MNTNKKNNQSLIYALFGLLLLGSIAFMAILYVFEIRHLNKLEALYFDKTVDSYQKNLAKNLQEYYTKQLTSFIDDDIKKAMKHQDREQLLQLTFNLFTKAQQQDPYLEILHYSLPSGHSLLRLHQPESFGDNLAHIRPYINQVHQDHQRIVGFEPGVHKTTLYRIVEPVFLDNQYIGSVEIGVSPKKLLDLITHFNQLEGAIRFFNEDKPILISNINNEALLSFYEENLNQTQNPSVYIQLEKTTYRFYRFPIQDFFAHTIGEFVFFQDISEFYTQLHKTLLQMAALTLLLLALIFWLLRRLVTKQHEYLNSIYQRNKTILDAQSDIVIVTDGREINEVNQQFLTLLHFSSLESFKHQHNCVCELFMPGKGFISPMTDNLMWIEYILQHAERENLAQIQRRDERLIFRLFVRRLSQHETVVTMQNVTSIYVKEQELRGYLDLLDQNVLITSTDLQGNITYASEAFLKLSGYSLADLLGQNHRIIRHPNTPNDVYDDLWQSITNNKGWYGELENLKKDGSVFWSRISIHPKLNHQGIKIGYTAIRQDISDKKRIEILSITDALTQVYNRRHFDNMLPRFIQSAQRRHELIAFMMMDIDHFKLYNDTYGHQMGDYALQQVASTLNGSLKRADDYCFRLGGEEFGILLQADTAEKAQQFAHPICNSVENLHIEHKHNSASAYISVSVGLIVMPAKRASDVDELYRLADECLYQAKNKGRNRVVMHVLNESEAPVSRASLAKNFIES